MIRTLLINTAGKESKAIEIESMETEIEAGKILWVDVADFTEEDVKKVALRFGLDPYAVEDTLSESQRPKIESYGDHVFSIIKIPVQAGDDFSTQSIFIFFSETWVVTLHRGKIQIDQYIIDRVKTRGLSSNLKSPSTDVVFYMFFDFAVDQFYPVMDSIEEVLNSIEITVTGQMQSDFQSTYSKSDFAVTFLKLRGKIIELRMEITPLRDILGQIMRGSIPLVSDGHLKGFRDIYDHTFQITENVESLRERSFEVRDLHLNLITTSTNAIMKILTIVVVVFTPLSLIAGIYGTNFSAGFFQPGTGTWYGFYVMIASMIVISAIMLLFFRKMKIL